MGTAHLDSAIRGRRGRSALAPLLLGCLSTPAFAQVVQVARGRIAGEVVSAAGERIVGAEVRVIGARDDAAVTDGNGRFAFSVRGDSVQRLVVRRIGFTPETLTVRVPLAGDSVHVVRMVRASQLMRPVLVSAANAESNTTMALVRERARTAGNGYFVFRTDFMKTNPIRFVDILRRVPGVQLARTPGNPETVRLRENRCTPAYWIDGQPLAGIPFDPNTQPPSTIEAIEVYSSPATVPVQFRVAPMQFRGLSGPQECGVVVIWTRRAGRPVHVPRISADSIVHLLDARRVFEASAVDQPAAVQSIPEPEYPDSLLAAGVSGSAVIEFIVEADGSVNRESIGVVSATHAAFAEAVRLAALEAVLKPAMKAERAVAQVLQLPVTFTAPRRPYRP